MTTLNRETIVERVRKLLAHAESAGQIGNTAEAEAFAEKASELLLQHRIAEAEISQAQPGEVAEDIAHEWFDDFNNGARSKVAWRRTLVGAIASAHFCRFVGDASQGNYGGTLIGKPSDMAVVKYLVDVLNRAGESLGASYVDPSGVTTRADRNTFRLGFALAIGQRLKETRTKVEHKMGGNAVVLFQGNDRQVKVYAQRLYPQTVSSRAPSLSGSRSAYVAGQAAGQSVNLQPGVAQGNRARANVGAGQRQIGGGR